VFSAVGSREALQCAVVEEYDRRFLQDVFMPAMREPRGLPRLNAIMRLWLQRRATSSSARAASTAPAPSSTTTVRARCAIACSTA
jgi:hypothetical protein